MKKPGAIFLALILVSIVFRVWNVSQHDVWFDEAFTGVALHQPLPDMLATIKDDVHPPLYYLLAKPIAAVFGYSVAGIRLLSVLAGVLGIGVMFLFTRVLVSQRAALWTAALLVVLPFAIQYSQEARMYTLFALFVVASAFAFLRAVQKASWQWACLGGAFLGLTGLTHYLAFLYILLIPLAFFPWKKPLLGTKILAAYLLSAGMVFSPWLTTFFIHARHASDFPLLWITPATLQRAFETFQIFILGTPQGRASQGIIGPNQLLGVAPMVTLVAILIIIAMAIFSVARQRRSLLWPLLVLSFGQILLLYILSLNGKQYFVSRYMLPSAYFFCVLLGAALTTLRTSWATAILALYVFLMPLRSTTPPQTEWTSFKKDPLTQSIPHLYVLNPFEYMVAQYEFGPERVILYQSEYPNSPVVGWAGIGRELRQEMKIENVVNDPQGAIFTYETLPLPTFSPPHTTFQLLRSHGDLFLYDPAPLD